MNLSSYTFVALDLETTGLSQENDTIIEVAAVKFQLERDGDTFRMIDLEERSMLIDPEREIDEHISMITGISNAMVRGKSKWHEVKERVSAFIGDDSIIIGHNVLFDVAMLSSHGIELSSHKILDTFELSEIFSGDVESLNLGFLAKNYGFDDGSEHRALDDTKLSMKLFLYYLSLISKLSDPLLSLWQYARNKDESATIDTLLSIIDNNVSTEVWDHIPVRATELTAGENPTLRGKQKYLFQSLEASWDDEKKLIDDAVKNGRLFILTHSKKQSIWLSEKLSSEYRVSLIRERKSYISLQVINAWLQKKSWKRKETILIIRLIHWLQETKTGSIDEIKWYGDELSNKFLFSLTPGEETEYLKADLDAQKEAQILITESYNEDLKSRSLSPVCSTCIFRDIGELEKSLRYRDGIIIDWGYIDEDLKKLNISPKDKEELHYALSIIEEIITTVIERPSGPDFLPPGEYGETYFFTQKDLWHRGYIWLIWASEKLELFLESSISLEENYGIIESIRFTRLVKSFREIIRLAKIGNSHMNIVLELKNNRTRLTIIPRTEKNQIQDLIEKLGGEINIFTGYNISGRSIKRFLHDECSFDTEKLEEKKSTKVSKQSDSPRITGEKIVILGTNLKQMRTLSANLKKSYPDFDYFTQGISGGKSKMLHLYMRSKKAILLGLIDTWKDESILWENTETLSITKIPFDPPNDPFYLARTVGMSNNFEIYSIPMAINTVNTLIGRAKSANRNMDIFLCDEKLTLMSWGRNVLGELL